VLAAVQFLGSADSGIGLPSISRWASAHSARIKEKKAKNKNMVDGLTAGMDSMAIEQHYKQKLQEAKNDSERDAIQNEMEKAASETLLKVMWTTYVPSKVCIIYLIFIKGALLTVYTWLQKLSSVCFRTVVDITSTLHEVAQVRSL
jgi:hypothetical protein